MVIDTEDKDIKIETDEEVGLDDKIKGRSKSYR